MPQTVQISEKPRMPKLAFDVAEVRKTVPENASKALRPPKRRPQVGKDL